VLLSARLDPERFETLLVAGAEGPREGNILSLGRFDPVRPVAVPQLGRRVAPFDDFRALIHVTKIARAFRPDVVHTHLAKAGLVGRVAARLAGARVVVHTYHGSVFRGYFGQRQSTIYKWIERGLALLSTRIVAITPQVRAELLELGIAPADKIREIALGFDLAPFRDAPDRDVARDRLQLPRDIPLVVLAARLVPIKDVPTFLHSMVRLSKEIPNVRAIIVGDGDDRASLERLADELGLRPRCEFLGWRADMADVYASADVVALSSLNEGAPVTAIEAMATSRAVVATAVGGVPDVVIHRQTGLLVSPRQPGELAAALQILLSDKALRDSYGRAGRERALSCFSASRLVADIEKLYLAELGRV
jgi:glycosyltransferase involved in cell wall biosynthesis